MVQALNTKPPQWQHAEKGLQTNTPATLVNGTTIFRVIGGPILLQQLVSYCITPNDATGSTLLWSADGDVGAATPFTAACASLASFAAGGAIICSFATISTIPALAAQGVGLSGTTATGIIVPAGIITIVVGIGSTTGKWLHYMRYMPMAPQAYAVLA
jgi:hypothetical protein